MQQELLLSSGKLVVKDSKFYFVPKPIQADTIQGKDCLALTKVLASEPKAGSSKALVKRPATSSGAPVPKLVQKKSESKIPCTDYLRRDVIKPS